MRRQRKWESRREEEKENEPSRAESSCNEKLSVESAFGKRTNERAYKSDHKLFVSSVYAYGMYLACPFHQIGPIRPLTNDAPN